MQVLFCWATFYIRVCWYYELINWSVTLLQTWSSTCRAPTMAASWPTRRLPSPCPSSTTSWRRRWWWSSATWGTSRMSLWPASWTSSRKRKALTFEISSHFFHVAVDFPQERQNGEKRCNLLCPACLCTWFYQKSVMLEWGHTKSTFLFSSLIVTFL